MNLAIRIDEIFSSMWEGKISPEEAHRELCFLGHTIQKLPLPWPTKARLRKELYWAFRGVEERLNKA